MATKYYAAHDDITIYAVGACDPEKLREDAARETGYDSYAELIAEGNKGFDVTEINPDLALEIAQNGYDGGQVKIIDGVIVRPQEG